MQNIIISFPFISGWFSSYFKSEYNKLLKDFGIKYEYAFERARTKNVVSIIFIPYFVNIKDLSDIDIIVKLIKEWLSKCSKLRSLDTTYNNNFDYKIKYHIESL